MPFFTKFPGNLFVFGVLYFFLSFFLMMEEGVHAEELSESDFFGESFEEENGFEVGDRTETEFRFDEVKSFEFRDVFFK